MQFIDTHSHIYADQFNEDRGAMIQRAFDENVGKIYMPNIDSGSIEGMMALENQYAGKCFSMMGLHPCSVKEDFEKELALVKEWLDKREFCAVGEIGIDLYWDKTFFEEQKIAFRTQIKWAKELKRPIVIHARESLNEILDIVEEEKDENLSGIFHCFTGDASHASRIQDLDGFLVGIGGVVTFKKSGENVREVLKTLDLERMVLETDAPYLSPAPNRGKRNESSNIPIIARKLAEIKGVEVEKIAEVTTLNAEKLFSPFV